MHTHLKGIPHPRNRFRLYLAVQGRSGWRIALCGCRGVAFPRVAFRLGPPWPSVVLPKHSRRRGCFSCSAFLGFALSIRRIRVRAFLFVLGLLGFPLSFHGARVRALLFVFGLLGFPPGLRGAGVRALGVAVRLVRLLIRASAFCLPGPFRQRLVLARNGFDGEDRRNQRAGNQRQRHRCRQAGHDRLPPAPAPKLLRLPDRPGEDRLLGEKTPQLGRQSPWPTGNAAAAPSPGTSEQIVSRSRGMPATSRRGLGASSSTCWRSSIARLPRKGRSPVSSSKRITPSE